MTLARMAQMALDVQNACNLSGVVHSFAEIVSAMRTEHGFDTAQCNQHPVSQLFASKISDLTGGDSFDTFNAAHAACEQLAGCQRSTFARACKLDAGHVGACELVAAS